MEMDSFTVKVDLSAFFDDERKMSVVLVDPELTTVECLQNKVQRIFDLSKLHFITEDGCFIPLQESINILRQTSTIKAFLLKEHKDERKMKKRKLKVTSEDLEETIIDVPNKYESLDAQILANAENGSTFSCAGVKVNKRKVISRRNGFEDNAKSTKNHKAEQFEKLKQKPFAQFRCLLQNNCEKKPRVLKFVKITNSKIQDDLQLPRDNENEIMKNSDLDKTQTIAAAAASAIENDNFQIDKVENKHELIN